jgi:hypothetical protein
VPKPEALLGKLLQRSWSPTTISSALHQLFQISIYPTMFQPLDIKGMTEALLQAVPAEHFCQHPTELLPAIACACRPAAVSANLLAPLAEAAALLLKSIGTKQPSLLCSPAYAQQSLLAAVINAIITAQAPPYGPAAAKSEFYAYQMKMLNLLLEHCTPPADTGGFNPTAFITTPIKAALLAGVEPGLLEALLSCAPSWRPDHMREMDALGNTVLFHWAAETRNYANLYPIIARTAAARGATQQLVLALRHLAQLAQPLLDANDPNFSDLQQRMQCFLQALADPVCNVAVLDLLPVLSEAAHTGNMTMLTLFSFSHFRWPATQLAPLLASLAGGRSEDCIVAMMVVPGLVDGQPGFSTLQIAQAAAAAVDAANADPLLDISGYTQRMCDELLRADCSGGSFAAAALGLGRPDVVALLEEFSCPSRSIHALHPLAWLPAEACYMAVRAAFLVNGQLARVSLDNVKAAQGKLKQSNVLRRFDFRWQAHDHNNNLKVLEAQYRLPMLLRSGPAAAADSVLPLGSVLNVEYDMPYKFAAAATSGTAGAAEGLDVEQMGAVEFMVRVVCFKQEDQEKVSAVAGLVAMAVMMAQLHNAGGAAEPDWYALRFAPFLEKAERLARNMQAQLLSDSSVFAAQFRKSTRCKQPA